MDHTFSDQNYSKMCKFCTYTTSHSFFIYLLLAFHIFTVQWLNCTNLKYELNRSYNGGGEVYVLKSELLRSSIQYIKVRIVFRWWHSLSFSCIYKYQFFYKTNTHKKFRKTIMFTYRIPRALLRNKIVFLYYCENSIIQ